MAYSPGVAEPCLKISENKEDVYKYTAKGNLVAVITNGTAVLGFKLVCHLDLRNMRCGCCAKNDNFNF